MLVALPRPRFALLGALCAAPLTASETQLAPPESIPITLTSLWEAELLDYDDDGDPDLVTCHAMTVGAGALTLFENDGAGGFTADTVLPTQDWVAHVAAGDVNGDGVVDLVAVLWNGSLQSFLGAGGGAFQTLPAQPVGLHPQAIELGDLDGDEHLDAAIAYWGNGGATVLAGDGLGGFTPVHEEEVPGDHAFDVRITDVNGDTHRDVLFTSYSAGVTVLTGDGAGGFLAQAPIFMGNGAWSLDVEDLNGDGVPDLFTTNRDSGDIAWRLGAGDGSFGPRDRQVTELYSNDSELADLNGDGDLDVWTVSADPAHVLVNDGTPLFENDLNRPNVCFVTGALSADVDGDGDVDLALWGCNEITLYRNETPQETDLLLHTSHVVGGLETTLTLSHGTPGTLAMAVVSLHGTGLGPYVPFFDERLDVLAPRRPGGLVPVAPDGTAEFHFTLPASLAGSPVWFQGIEFQRVSNVIATAIH